MNQKTINLVSLGVVLIVAALVISYLPTPTPETGGTLKEPDVSSDTKSKVADFKLDNYDIWKAMDSDRTEYVSYRIWNNGTVDAEYVRYRGEYERETIDYLEPGEGLTFTHVTQNRETDFGGVSFEWSYTNDDNESVRVSKAWIYGRDGVSYVEKNN